MLRSALRAVLVVSVLMLGATEASARKIRFFHFGGIGSSSEQIVKVLDLPDIPALRRADGHHVDLGYKFKSAGGEWVGYIGSDREYLPLSDDAVQMLLAVSGIDRLPPVPERPAATSSGFGGIFTLLGAGIFLYWIYSFFTGSAGWITKHFARGDKEAAVGADAQRTMSDAVSPSASPPVSFKKPAAAVAIAGGGLGMGRKPMPARSFGRRA